MALRKAGFGGIDAIGPKISDFEPKVSKLFTAMAAQAVNDQVLCLRKPLSSSLSLSSSSSSQFYMENLVILGSQTLKIARMAQELSDCLARFCGKVIELKSLPTASEMRTLGSGTTTFVSLMELDSPIFEHMTSDTMDGLKRMLQLARHVLWVTGGAHQSSQNHEAYHAASLAFIRSISNESTHISFNTLHIPTMNENTSSSRVVAEQLLRQVMLEELDPRQLTWSKEPETVLRDGKLFIPRILPNLQQNDRLNACRRVISNTVPVATSNFSVATESSVSVPAYSLTLTPEVAPLQRNPAQAANR